MFKKELTKIIKDISGIKDFDIIGASPELLVKVEDGIVEIRPIAGTRQRGETDEEDKAANSCPWYMIIFFFSFFHLLLAN